MAAKWYLSIYSIILFFVIGAAIATSALFLLLIPQSGEIIRLAEWRMLRAQSMKIEANLQYHGTKEEVARMGTRERRNQDLNFDLRGILKRGEEQSVDGNYDFDIRLGREDVTEIGGNFRKIGNKNFVSFSEMPDRLGGINVGVFKDKTLRVNLDEILPSTTLPFVGGTQRLDEYDRAYLLSEMRDTPFLAVEEKLKDDVMHGVSVYHYKIRPEKLYVREFVVLAEALRLDRELTSRERITWDNFFTYIEPLEGEIWIGANDYYVHRLRLQFRYDNGKGSGVLSFTADFSEFNQPTEIAVPPVGDVEDAGAYAESLIGGLTSHLPMAKSGSGNRQTAAVDSLGELVEDSGMEVEDDDADGLPVFLERFYGSDFLNPDTDGDGVWDGEEVDTAWSPTGPRRLFDFTFGTFD